MLRRLGEWSEGVRIMVLLLACLSITLADCIVER